MEGPSYTMEGIIDTHIHLSHHYSGGLKNEWHPEEAESFRRDWSESDYLASIEKGAYKVKHAVFVECFNRPPVEEAKWVLKMIDDPKSVVCALTMQIVVQDGAKAVQEALAPLRLPDGSLPVGLKGARMVFMALGERNTPKACLEPLFLEGLAELERQGLHWEFTCNPSMAPNLAVCIKQFPGMTFIICHAAHNGNDGGDMESWGPAMDELGTLPNVYLKTGAVEEWGVPDPERYMERAVTAFPFERILYESNWFVNEAMGHEYDKTAKLLHAACLKKGASEVDLQNVFANNARRAYRLNV